MNDQATGVTDILDRLDRAVANRQDAGEGKVSVRTLLDSFGERSYGPFLLIPALLELSPIGGIPGVPTVIAFMVLTTAAQMLVGRKHIWVPGFIEKRCVDGSKIEAVDSKVRPVARWLDRHTRERLRLLTRTPAVKVAAVCIMLLCLTVPPLELIPFGSSIPMAAIAMFGLALLVRDGLLMLFGFIAVVAAAVGIVLLV
ncbi:exopolysaccharide biosynthesis protein [Parvularcula maris]|uniref:Exopolysaccharide biosynthesis protein n=1 Tax=Parvularcula maris TaxID=2965077 RepID=A0A9X2LB09_9PROT|nr:exopolysaccharide biosynthesis protein [Parvularcula maris]MCQ8186174.1 exopolysaccharide biosynthesis protein [Parvularcula maris]